VTQPGARRGAAFGLAAYLIWGLVPLYWPLLRPAAPTEILAHRIVWSLVLLGALLAQRGGLARVRALVTRQRALLLLASGLIGVNWYAYIWGVTSGRVVETSLGYFVNPLVSVVLGVVVLRERLTPAQTGAIALAALAVIVLTVAHGHVPWLALLLAVTFGLYGLVKKKAGVGAVESLFVETSVLFVPALAYLVLRERIGTAAFLHVSRAEDALLVSTGVVTTAPLLCFGAAAIRVPLSTLGLLQYLSPILQFACGVLAFHEPMRPARWAGFALVWSGLAVFTIDAVARVRRPAG
jgi:chloramphenicol-sensitive protein RarD